MSTSANKANHSATAVGNDVLIIAAEIWSELEGSSTVESPFMVKPISYETNRKSSSDFDDGKIMRLW